MLRSSLSASALGVVLGLAAPLCAQNAEAPTTSGLFRIPAPISPQLHQLLHSQFDVMHSHAGPNDPLEVVVSPGAEEATFRRLVPNATLLRRGRPFRDIEAERLAEAPPGIDIDAGYYTTTEIEQEIDSLVAAFPTLARKVDLTQLPGAVRTHNNNPIWALKVSDNPQLDEDEPTILLAAQHHARELNAPHMVVGAMNRVLNEYSIDPGIQAAVDGKEIWFVPCVNPDGVDHVWAVDNFWRKNRRNNGGGVFGVDLNRNFGTLWGACGSSSRTSSSVYRGPAPNSEPETQTMRAFVQIHRPEIYVDVHSSGQEILRTYPPCSSSGASIDAMLERYIDDLRAPMNYAKRDPSASGEAPEDHWNESGSMSFLTEIGTSFQPAFTTTVTEEARWWPGFDRILKNWEPAATGHVRSLFQDQPIDAQITFAPNQFSHGEQTRSRGRDGRYSLWLPLGTWQVTVSASGFETQTFPVTVTSYDQAQNIDITLIPVFPAANLAVIGVPRTGSTVTLFYQAPGDAGLPAFIPLSGGNTPGTPIGPRTLPLNADALFFDSFSFAPVLIGNVGTVAPNGVMQAQLSIPPIVALAGVTIYTAGISFETGYPSDVKRWSSSVPIVILP